MTVIKADESVNKNITEWKPKELFDVEAFNEKFPGVLGKSDFYVTHTFEQKPSGFDEIHASLTNMLKELKEKIEETGEPAYRFTNTVHNFIEEGLTIVMTSERYIQNVAKTNLIIPEKTLEVE
jgi:uncharacterized protein YutD